MFLNIPAQTPREEVENAKCFYSLFGNPRKLKISPDSFENGKNPYIQAKFGNNNIIFSNLGWAYGGIRYPGNWTSGGAGLQAAIEILKTFGLSIEPKDLPLESEQKPSGEITQINEDPLFFKYEEQVWVPVYGPKTSGWSKIRECEYEKDD